jgi:hypothetical protein
MECSSDELEGDKATELKAALLTTGVPFELKSSKGTTTVPIAECDIQGRPTSTDRYAFEQHCPMPLETFRTASRLIIDQI